MKIAVAQLELRVGEPAANLTAADRAITRAAEAGADVVVLPELANSGYLFRDREEAVGLAEPLDGPSVRAWAARSLRDGLVIVAGLCLRDGHLLRNAAVVIDGGEPRGVYAKAHLWADERDVFAAGDDAPPVVDTAAGRIAPLVCYDIEFPEWVRGPALAGADLLAVPANWPFEAAPEGERHRLVVNAQAAAYTNRMFVAVADRCGAERGAGWVGGSTIIGPDGYPLAGPVARDEPAFLLADADPRLARDKRLGPRNDLHADRRTDLY